MSIGSEKMFVNQESSVKFLVDFLQNHQLTIKLDGIKNKLAYLVKCVNGIILGKILRYKMIQKKIVLFYTKKQVVKTEAQKLGISEPHLKELKAIPWDISPSFTKLQQKLILDLGIKIGICISEDVMCVNYGEVIPYNPQKLTNLLKQR
jgi:hypothetical protein